MRNLTVLAAAALCGVGAVWLLTASAARDRIKANEPFLELPYLQLGDSARLADPESLTLLWQTQTATGRWTVEIKTGDQFTATAAPVRTEVPLAGGESFSNWQARLAGLTPGMRFDYRVLLDGKEVFSAGSKGRAPAAQPYKFAVWGDSGADTPEQRQIAVMADRFNPDFVFITGDIVYSRGQVHEYRTKYFPIYNAPRSDVKLGAPLIRSIPFIAAPGNHDLGNRDLGAHPGGLAYFLFWRQPLNGPDSQVFGKLEGPADRQQAFRAASEGRFPRMANFSFDWGNSHWLVLDTNNYADWSNAELQKWIAADLASARDADWRFVGFHHPGFNSAKAHFKDQQARVLAKLFEAGKVDVVFAGHVHNYQRSYPLKFVPGKFDLAKSKEVAGTWALDRAYDGKSNTKPDGIVYLVTGAGGNRLYNEGQEGDPKSWQEFTKKFVSKTHSLTQVEIRGKRAEFRQVNATGGVVDEFAITK